MITKKAISLFECWRSIFPCK